MIINSNNEVIIIKYFRIWNFNELFNKQFVQKKMMQIEFLFKN